LLRDFFRYDSWVKLAGKQFLFLVRGEDAVVNEDDTSRTPENKEVEDFFQITSGLDV
jgi:hypothetical protein